MAKIDTPIDSLRERLTQLLADWGAEMSMVLKELEDARARLAEIERSSIDREDELDELRHRIVKQDALIDTLTNDAEEAGQLRKMLSTAELEAEKVRAELESKHDLIKVLRADADKKNTLQDSLDKAEKALEAERQAGVELRERVAAAGQTAASSQDDKSELAAVRAELDAKTALIEKFRADAERAEHREESLDSQAKAKAELKESATRTSEVSTESTVTVDDGVTTMRAVPELPFSDLDDEEDDPAAQAATDLLAERTLAINMRDSLLDARKTQEQGSKKASGTEG
jgi:chromosome segregation ATPase